MAIRQQATGDLNDPWRYITGDLRQIVGDKRNITSLQWVKVSVQRFSATDTDAQSLLVWSKVSTVHLWTEGGQDGYKWQGTRDLRLQRVGNWASANALGACVGEQVVRSLYMYSFQAYKPTGPTPSSLPSLRSPVILSRTYIPRLDSVHLQTRLDCHSQRGNASSTGSITMHSYETLRL